MLCRVDDDQSDVVVENVFCKVCKDCSRPSNDKQTNQTDKQQTACLEFAAPLCDKDEEFGDVVVRRDLEMRLQVRRRTPGVFFCANKQEVTMNKNMKLEQMQQ